MLYFWGKSWFTVVWSWSNCWECSLRQVEMCTITDNLVGVISKYCHTFYKKENLSSVRILLREDQKHNKNVTWKKSNSNTVGLNLADVHINRSFNLFFLHLVVWSLKTSLTPPLYQDRKVSSHVFCVGGFDITSLYYFSVGIWKCSDSVVFIVFHFINTTQCQVVWLIDWCLKPI